MRVPIPSHYRAEDDVALSPPQKYNQNISNRINAETTTKEHPTGHLPVAFGYEGGGGFS